MSAPRATRARARPVGNCERCTTAVLTERLREPVAQLSSACCGRGCGHGAHDRPCLGHGCDRDSCLAGGHGHGHGYRCDGSDPYGGGCDCGCDCGGGDHGYDCATGVSDHRGPDRESHHARYGTRRGRPCLRSSRASGRVPELALSGAP